MKKSSLLSISITFRNFPATPTIIQAMTKTTVVRIAVPRFESIPSMPILPRMAVRLANTADKTAYTSHGPVPAAADFTTSPISSAAPFVPAPGAEPTLDSLRAFLADRLARYKVPRDVALVTELPRNPSGKLTKHVLRSRVREGTTVA